jgi:hypothetical protein
MKKLFAILFVFAFAAIIPFRSQAQMYDKGTITINPGISFGTIGFGGYGLYGTGAGFLPITANVEYSINDKFAVGPYLGYYSRRYVDYWRYTVLSFGARGTFHASELINDALDANINTEKLDLYGTALLGLETFTTRWETSVQPYGNYSNVRLGIVLGARYMFTDNIGGFLELGRGALGYSTLGLTFKLN